MKRDPRRPKAPTPSPKEGPVRPGTPLHRLLELVAIEVAKDLERDADPSHQGLKDLPHA